jgi:hypothetical protein
MRVVVDNKAWADLDQIRADRQRRSEAARQTLRRIFHTIAQLERFPRLARPGRVRGTFERVVPDITFSNSLMLKAYHAFSWPTSGRDAERSQISLVGRSGRDREETAALIER